MVISVPYPNAKVAYRLRWGWIFLERTRILSGIQFTTHFIEFVVAETKRFVGSFVNVILTQQTCGQHSSRAVESKRRALRKDFSERIYVDVYIYHRYIYEIQAMIVLTTISLLRASPPGVYTYTCIRIHVYIYTYISIINIHI